MDIVTQGLLGAALAQAAAPPSQSRAATVVGFCAGVLPDADALLRSSADPLLFLDWHRHFTHALAFVPAGALIASILLAPFYLRPLGATRLYGYAFLGYALSGLLDACTSYGTHLWWPFSDERVAWRIISIVDPIFSGILLVGVVAVFWRGLRWRSVASI
jgi:inner membrane protein